jgi:hypothetical protein
MEKYLTENGKLDPVYTLQAIKENQEMQDIKAKALANDTFMKAPNGKPTNLTERQWLQVRTKAFKEWFGDWENDPENASKVVDENGEPLVVYHHTDNSNLKEFSTDFDNYFAKDGGTKEAIFFDENKTGTLNRKHDIPVFLNIKDLHEYNETKEQLHQRGTTYRQVVNESAAENNTDGGVHMKDFDDNKMEHQSIWIVHNPNQVKSATDNNGMFSTENNNIRMFIGKRARNQFEHQLRKARPDLSDAEIKSTLDFLHSLEDSKENTAYIKTAIRWIANRSLTLPQDHTKAYQVFEIARKKHLDLQKYNTLGELIASPEMQPKEKEKVEFNPDEAKTFSNKRTVTTKGGRVFTVYDVENTEEGQREVCKALAAHYKTSPWCLSTFTSKGEPTESAKRYWKDYNALPRKIAYENGKPVAFNSASNITITFRGMPIAYNSKRFWFKDIGDPMFATDEEMNAFRLQTNELLEQYKKDGLIKYDGSGNKYVWQNYNLTEKAIKELKETEKEAWWDVEDTHPQDSLSDSIITDPNSIGSLRNVAEMVAEYLGLLGTPNEIDTLVEMQQQNIPLTEDNYRSFVHGQTEFVQTPVNLFQEGEEEMDDFLPFFITPKNDNIQMFIDKKAYGNPLTRDLYYAENQYEKTVQQINRLERELNSNIYEDSISTKNGSIKIVQNERSKDSSKYDKDTITLSSGRSIFDRVSISIQANASKNLIGGSILFPSSEINNPNNNYLRLENPIRSNHASLLKTVLQYFIANGHNKPHTQWTLYAGGKYGKENNYKGRIKNLSEVLGVDVSPYFQFEMRDGEEENTVEERVIVDAKGLIEALPTLVDTKAFSKLTDALQSNEQNNVDYTLKRRNLTQQLHELNKQRDVEWKKVQNIKKKIKDELDEMSDLPFFMTPNGEVYGFVDEKGNIYLDETVISPEHPIHEYTHLWDRTLAKTNPKLWKKGVKLMQEGAS